MQGWRSIAYGKNLAGIGTLVSLRRPMRGMVGQIYGADLNGPDRTIEARILPTMKLRGGATSISSQKARDTDQGPKSATKGRP